MSRPAPRRRKPSPAALAAVTVLIAAPLVALLWVGSYNHESPHLGGIPFFYWYQLMWVLICALCTSLAYLVLRRSGSAPADRAERRGWPEEVDR